MWHGWWLAANSCVKELDWQPWEGSSRVLHVLDDSPISVVLRLGLLEQCLAGVKANPKMTLT